jgi:hypothetical protein
LGPENHLWRRKKLRKDVFQRLLDQQTSLRNKMSDANTAWYGYYSAMLSLYFFFGVNPKVMMASIMEYAFVIFFFRSLLELYCIFVFTNIVFSI